MRTNVISLLVSILAFSAASLAQSTATSSDVVTGTGCVRKGVEAGCLMIEDVKTNKAINGLFDPSKKPSVDSMISYTGTKHSGPTTCMQGQAIKITKWETLKMMCPKAKDK